MKSSVSSKKFVEILHSTPKYIHVCLKTGNVLAYLPPKKDQSLACLRCHSPLFRLSVGFCVPPSKTHGMTWSPHPLPAPDARGFFKKLSWAVHSPAVRQSMSLCKILSLALVFWTTLTWSNHQRGDARYRAFQRLPLHCQ